MRRASRASSRRSRRPAGPRTDGVSTSPMRREIKRVVAEVAARFGRLDILINNAGFGGFSPLGGRRLRSHLGSHHRGLADCATADGARRAGASAEVRRRAHRQYRIDRGPRRDARRQSLRGRQDRSHRTHARAGGRSRSRGNHRQLHLPRTDSHRADRRDSRRAQDDLRQAPHRAEAIRLSGRSRAHHLQPVSARRRRTSPARSFRSTEA